MTVNTRLKNHHQSHLLSYEHPFLNYTTVRMIVILTAISYNDSLIQHARLIHAIKVLVILQGPPGPGSECTASKYILTLVCSFVLPSDVI